LAGFNHNFNAPTSGPKKSTLLKLFSTISKAGCQPTIIPLLKVIWTEMREASAIMCRIRSDLLKQSKASHEDDECNKLPARSIMDEE
ncbi:hypothetical protein BYT27DRAFT_7199849, partial [Phlegmacium glaucopus]